MTKYRLYVDEVGDTGLKRVNRLDHRFLSLTGVVAESDYVRRRIHPELEAIKVRYFDSHPDEPVVLHRREMVNGRRPFQALADTETRAAFDNELLVLLSEWDYQVITVCLDKQAFAASDLSVSNDPYHYCLDALVEIFGDWLLRRNARGDVMSEARRGKEDVRLKERYRTLRNHGANSVSAIELQSVLTSREIKVKTKEANISGLQVADLLAHPSRNAVLEERNLLIRPLGPYAARITAILSAKYCCDSAGKPGKRFLP